MPKCLRCGAELTVNEEGVAPVLCDRCAGRATGRARSSMNYAMLSQFPATTFLVAINLAVFSGMLLGGGLGSIMGFSPDLLVRWGGNWGPLTFSGDYWRLVTAGFVHGSLLHFALNMWCLWSLGQLSERLFGSSVTLAVYLLTGVGGALLSIGWNPGRLEVGASGAVFGIAGAVLSGIKFGNVSVASALRKQIFSSLIFFVIFNLSFGMLPGIDNVCHLGGLISGLLFGAPLATAAASGKKSFEWTAIALAAMVLIGLASWQVEVKGHVSQLAAGQLELQQGNYPDAIQRLQRAVASGPKDYRAHVLLGNAYDLSHQRDLAIAEYQTTLQLNPDLSDVKQRLEELQGGAPPQEK
jgi:membrane associated rhomboid family serine protease